MAIPKFDQTMLPILKVLSTGEKSLREVGGVLESEYFSLSDDEKRETVSSGESRFLDRVSWGRTYLKKAGLIEQRERGGKLKITQEGKEVLDSGIESVNVDYLDKYPSFIAFKSGGKEKEEIASAVSDVFSPQDMIDSGFSKLYKTLKSDLLEKLQSTNPYYFEKVVLILFQKMGYGDFQETPKSGDGGVDGIISQDKLGLEKIYIQAKRYSDKNKVREPEIRNFIGAMSGDVSKGIFVTTSCFDESAVSKAKSAFNHKIILIDGEQLTELMIKHNVGVQIQTSYEIKDLDNDFFEVAGS